MCAKIPIVFHGVDDGVKDILSNLEFRFEKRDKILTVIGIHPYTVLQPDKSYLSHHCTETRPNSCAPFWYIEHDHSPPFVPFLFLINKSDFGLF